MPERSVVVAASDVLVAELVAAVLADGSFRVEAAVTSSARLLEAVRRTAPDLVVATTTVRPDDLMILLPSLLAAGPRVLAIATDTSADPAGLLLGGASGYLALHDLGTAELVRAAHSVTDGDAALHPAVAELLLGLLRERGTRLADPPSRPALTARETELLRTMVEGLGGKATAQRLGVTLKTIESHKSRIFVKLGVSTQAEAVAVALTTGLVADEGRFGANG